MRTMIGALALTLGLGVAAAPARAQDHADHAAHAREHAEEMHAEMERVHAQLGLTQAQAARLAAIHRAYAEGMRAHCAEVRAAGGPTAQTHQAMHPRMMAMADSIHQQAMAVLTPAQRARLDSLHAAHHAEMAGHGAAGHHAAGHDMHADSASMAKMHEMHGDMCQATAAAPHGG